MPSNCLVFSSILPVRLKKKGRKHLASSVGVSMPLRAHTKKKLKPWNGSATKQTPACVRAVDGYEGGGLTQQSRLSRRTQGRRGPEWQPWRCGQTRAVDFFQRDSRVSQDSIAQYAQVVSRRAECMQTIYCVVPREDGNKTEFFLISVNVRDGIRGDVLLREAFQDRTCCHRWQRPHPRICRGQGT